MNISFRICASLIFPERSNLLLELERKFDVFHSIKRNVAADGEFCSFKLRLKTYQVHVSSIR